MGAVKRTHPYVVERHIQKKLGKRLRQSIIVILGKTMYENWMESMMAQLDCKILAGSGSREPIGIVQGTINQFDKAGDAPCT